MENRESEKRENILDIITDAEKIGDGDKSALNTRIAKMEGEITSGGKDLSHYIQPLSVEEMAEQQQKERDQQIDAAARGERPYLPGGQAPRISDFYLVDTTMTPDAFLKLLNEEVLGNYDVQDRQGTAEFGIMVMRHRQGQAQSGTLPAGIGTGQELTVPAKDMLIVKLDAGPWAWYDAASMAIIAGIVRRVGRRAWRCAWAIDKQWSWVEHWRVDNKTGDSKITETIDGPANATVTAKARSRWNIDVRAAFDDLMKCAQWEALRQWLLCGKDGDPASLPVPFVARVSFLAGNLQCSEEDRNWVPQKWAEFFPGRKPEDGALHLQAYYTPIKPSRPIPEREKVRSFRTEPPLLGS